MSMPLSLAPANPSNGVDQEEQYHGAEGNRGHDQPGLRRASWKAIHSKIPGAEAARLEESLAWGRVRTIRRAVRGLV